MSLKIKDLPRFVKDCEDYQRRIEAIENPSHKEQAISMYNIFIEAVNVLDNSVENLVDSGPVFGNEHQLLRENLQTVRLDLVRWLKKHSTIEQSNPLEIQG